MLMVCRRFLATSATALCALMLTAGARSTSAPVSRPTKLVALNVASSLRYPWAGEYFPISVVVNPSMADRDTNVTIQVNIASPAPTGGSSVSLTNNDPSQFSSWTDQITVPAGSTTATATVRTSHWGSGSRLSITATCAGGSVSTTLQTLGSIIDDN